MLLDKYIHCILLNWQMIKTLGLFLSPKERKMSRIVSDQVDEGALYEPDLFIQGIILVR